MKVLVFAHVPPPLHGQSYMVQLLLENLGQSLTSPSSELVLYHLDARLSDGLDDIGSWRLGKFFRLAGYLFQAWWLRWKYSLDAIYYVPTPPGKRGALYRDWLVLFLVAPWFKIKILHWHAVGLGQSIKDATSSRGLRGFEAGITRRLFSGHNLSCVLNEWGQRDVEIFCPKKMAVVANGIPDPCAETATNILAQRHHRVRERALGSEENPVHFELLYLAHATRSKGLFDAIDAVAKANALLTQKRGGWRIRLTVAGAFLHREEEADFQVRIRREDLKLKSTATEASAIIYAGHVGPVEKEKLLAECDAMCFASYYPYEGQPVSIIEALAHGMPVVMSRWRALPEMVSPALAHLVEPGNPEALAEELIHLAEETRFEDYRQYFLDHYSLAAHIHGLREAFLSVASPTRS